MDKNSIGGMFELYNAETGETLSKSSEITLRVCHGEKPTIVEIADSSLNSEQLGINASITFDFKKLKELVNRKEYENA